MGMTVDEAIKRIDNIMFTKFTTVKDEDAFLTAIETMKKYQKIQEIVKSKTTRVSYDIGFRQIKKVVENGNVD